MKRCFCLLTSVLQAASKLWIIAPASAQAEDRRTVPPQVVSSATRIGLFVHAEDETRRRRSKSALKPQRHGVDERPRDDDAGER